MRFMIDHFASLMCVDNATVSGMDLSTLPANVSLVAYDGKDGGIETNDAPSVRTVFTDPSPYQPLLNAWMTATATVSPALNLAQAKSIKNGLVLGIYSSKRRAPIVSGGQTFQTTDDAVQALAATISWVDFTPLVASINASLSTLVPNINADMSYLSDVNNSYFVTFANSTSDIQTKFVNTPSDGSNGGASAYIESFKQFHGNPQIGLFGFDSLATPAAIAVTYIPAPAAIGFGISGAAEATAALTAMAARRNSLLAARGTKLAQIAALSTVAAVIAYNATTGWP